MTHSIRLLPLAALALAAPAATQCHLQSVVPTDPDPGGDASGGAVAAQGRRILVGNYLDEDAAPNGGSAAVFEHTGTAWVQTAELLPDDPGPNDTFGRAAELGPGTALIGAPGWDSPGTTDGVGAVYAFELQGGAWTQAQRLQASDAGSGDAFGWVLEIEGGCAFVGSPGHEPNGAVYVFEQQGGVWVEVQKLTTASQNIGGVISVWEDTAVFGAPVAGIDTGLGSAFVFERQGSVWVEVQEIDAPPSVWSKKSFATAVGIAADRILVGHPSENNAEGVFYAYEPSPSGWVQTQQVLPTPPVPSSMRLGSTIVMDERHAFVGGQDGVDSDSLRLYEHTSGAWGEVGTIQPADDDATNFGLPSQNVFALSSDVFVAGALDDFGTATGSAWVYSLPPETYCTGKTSSLGCVPSILLAGEPSLSAPAAFPISAVDVIGFKNGLFFYGYAGPASLPFQGGTLCVAPPLRRTPVTNSGGNPPPPFDCSGVLTIDFNAWLQGGNDPGVSATQALHGQFWFRDPDQTDGTGAGLSNAVEMTVCP